MSVATATLQSVAEDLTNDRRTPRADKTLRRRHSPLSSTAEQLRVLAAVPLDGRSASIEFETLTGKLRPAALEIFQVNLGKLCNMTCRHCHVDAGPDRLDAVMSDEIVDIVIAAIGRTRAHTVDITGGAPELHPRFRDLVDAAVTAGKHVMDRCTARAGRVRSLHRGNAAIERCGLWPGRSWSPFDARVEPGWSFFGCVTS